MRVYYVGFFDFQDSLVQRKYIVSATNKMEYIAGVVNSLGYSSEIVSLSLSNKKGFAFHRARRVEKEGICALFFPTVDFPFYISSIKNAWRCLCVLFWGLFHLRREDVVLSYHTTSKTSNVLLLLRRLIGYRLLLEVEEVYSDVANVSLRVRKREFNAFSNCDGFIFSTELLEEKLNSHHKPYVIIYGTYKVAKEEQSPKPDDVIHVIYAGTFDQRKGGASAATAARYLPKNYKVHICGFGKPAEEEFMKQLVHQLQVDGCNIQYDGLLKGASYIGLLQKCSIGLSTQDPSAKFNNTSFPSKILSYLANGLSVVSIRLDAVERSKIGKNVHYYDVQTPEAIAESIMSVEPNQSTHNRALISSLDISFREELDRLIKGE